MNTDPPYNVKVEPRSNNAIAAGNSSFTNYHHQQFDLARHPEKSKPTTPEDAGQGPAAGQRLRFGRRLRPDAHRVVRQHGPRAGARPRVLHLGRLCQLRQLPAGAEGHEALLLPGDHLGQGASGAHPQGLHGQPRVVFLWLEGGRRPRLPRPEQRRGRVERQEDQPATRWST